jgi:hypothetical protein
MSRLSTSIITPLVASFIAIVPMASQAFGLPNVPGLSSNSSGSSAGADLSGSQDQLVKQYVSAGKSVLNGNAKMAEAVGLKEEAAASRAAGDALTDGATRGTLSDSDKAASDGNAAVAAALKNTDQMDAPAKAEFAGGMVSLAQGLVQYIGMRGPFDSFRKGLSSASPMMLPKLQSGAYVATSFPTSVKNLAAALSNAISFAKSHDIAVPKDATDALSNL